jgi:hypothetical protein
MAADWNGDGVDEMVVVRPGCGQTADDQDGKWHWLVSNRGEATLFADQPFMSVQDGDFPIAAVWHAGEDADRPGIVRPSETSGKYDWHFWGLDQNDSPSPDVTFGDIGTRPVAGDFNGDGLTDIAVVRDGESQLIWEFDYDRDGVSDDQHAYGLKNDWLVVGVGYLSGRQEA